MFFRLQLLTRTGNVNFEEDDEEEELVWEDEQEVTGESNSGATTESKGSSELNERDIQRVLALENENEQLKQQTRSLQKHVSELETVIKEKDAVLLELRRSLDDQSAREARTAATIKAAKFLPATVDHARKTSPNGGDSSASDSSAEESVQMVNHSDANSLYTDEDSRHGEKTVLVSRGDITSPSTATASKVTTTPALRSKTAPYLAALDDEEEDSWT